MGNTESNQRKVKFFIKILFLLVWSHLNVNWHSFPLVDAVVILHTVVTYSGIYYVGSKLCWISTLHYLKFSIRVQSFNTTCRLSYLIWVILKTTSFLFRINFSFCSERQTSNLVWEEDFSKRLHLTDISHDFSVGGLFKKKTIETDK